MASAPSPADVCSSPRKARNVTRQIFRRLYLAGHETSKQDRDDSIKSKVNIKTLLHPNIFFTIHASWTVQPKRQLAEGCGLDLKSLFTPTQLGNEDNVLQQSVLTQCNRSASTMLIGIFIYQQLQLLSTVTVSSLVSLSYRVPIIASLYIYSWKGSWTPHR